MDEPIDAVITWVDGADPAHREKLNRYLTELGYRPKAANPSRFQDAGEIDWCLASLIRFAPWLRRIYIVTDNQRPQVLDTLKGTTWEDRVEIIDHQDIFSGVPDALPNFNSIAIESVLWRIPSLAERFIYLNDDFALLRPVQPGDFFRDGKIVLRGTWSRIPESIRNETPEQRARRQQSSAKNRAAQARGAALVGATRRFFRVPHTPHPLHKSSLARVTKLHPERVEENTGCQLRSGGQFQMDAAARHLDLMDGRAVIDNRLNVARLRVSNYSLTGLRLRLLKAALSKRTAFVCLQNLDQAWVHHQTVVTAWLKNRIGDPHKGRRH